MLATRKVHLRKGEKAILSDVSLCFPPGKVSIILGPNGAGKSSLLKLLSGEWDSSSGEVFWSEQNLHSLSVQWLGRHRAFLHQETHLDFSFSAEEVVLLGRLPHSGKQAGSSDRQRTRSALEQLELKDLAQRDYTTLSGGEKQRVQIARTLVQIQHAEDPTETCWLLDEPANNLDLVHQRKVLQLCRQQADAGTTVIMVLHDINLARRFADYCVLLRDGQCIAEGDAAKVLEPEILESTYGLPFQKVDVPDSQYPILLAIE
ncbi:MAG: heme ABC transporter ATP-binding protein [Opitutales bacterium]|nr:heme ABC transporter ATP-binding protein [Opitutales bacterium]